MVSRDEVIAFVESKGYTKKFDYPDIVIYHKTNIENSSLSVLTRCISFGEPSGGFSGWYGEYKEVDFNNLSIVDGRLVETRTILEAE